MGLFSSLLGGLGGGGGGGQSGTSSTSNRNTQRRFEFFQPEPEFRKTEVDTATKILEAMQNLVPFQEAFQTSLLGRGEGAVDPLFDTILGKVTGGEEDSLFKNIFDQRKRRLREGFSERGTKEAERFASLGSLSGGQATQRQQDLGREETVALDDAALDVAIQSLNQRESGIGQLLQALGLSSQFGQLPQAGRLQTQPFDLREVETNTTGTSTSQPVSTEFDQGQQIGSLIGSVGGLLLGGPAGAAVGSQLGGGGGGTGSTGGLGSLGNLFGGLF